MGRGRPIRVVSPAYDAPGAVIPVVVTAGRAPAGADVRFSIRAAGAPGECSGLVWRHAGGVSQRCWATLPRVAGSVTLTATATWEGGAVAPGRVTGEHRVEARGPVTAALSPGERDAVERCGNATPRVWLTFDDYFTDARRMEAMLAILRDKGVKARFFPMGGWARAHPGLVARLRAAGHDIGNHTLSHEALNAVSDAELNRQIAGGPDTTAPHQLRPGFGAGAFTTRVRDAAARRGQAACYWTSDLRDWARTPAPAMIATALHGDAYTPPVTAGGIVLLHMTGAHTIEVLPGLVDGLRARGLQLEPLPAR